MAIGNRDPDKLADKWATRVGASGPQIQDGVDAVSVSPGEKAAAQQARWLAAIQESAGRWADRLRAMPLQSWKDSMKTKGIPRIAAGAAAAKTKFANFMRDWNQFEDSEVSKLPPRGDVETNIARSAAIIRANHAAKGRFRQRGK